MTTQNDLATTVIITCDCTVCEGRSARVRGDGTLRGKPMTRTAIHNTVCLAHSVFARAASVQQYGPWAV